MDSRTISLIAERVIVQNIGARVPIAHDEPRSGFSLKPRVIGFMVSWRVPSTGSSCPCRVKPCRNWGSSVLFALRCPDVSGVARCSPCIQHHRNVREVLASAPPDDPLYQLAKEIMAMAAEPHRYDHDEVHGNALIEQQRLAGSWLVSAPSPTEMLWRRCFKSSESERSQMFSRHRQSKPVERSSYGCQ